VRVAIITGASRGFGRALATALAGRGWSLVLDARGEAALRTLGATLPGQVVLVPGDVTETAHRGALVDAAHRLGSIDLLCNNASELGPSPLPVLASYPEDTLARVYATNVLAPLALIRLALPSLRRRGGAIVNVSSDAAVEAYATWGGYGSSKAALDHASRVLAFEEPDVRTYAFDPGDMRTDMHQRAFPGEDISDRALPETVVPALLRLLDERRSSGRYSAAELLQVERAT
jgi:NAD(P)-dependent dehydrogenase (short-subunit alcohol dehydrogenase family)